MNSTENLNENLNNEQQEEQKKGFPLVWIIVLFLLILVLMTAVLAGMYLKEMSVRDKNVINLVPEGQVVVEASGEGAGQNGDAAGNAAGNTAGTEEKPDSDDTVNSESEEAEVTQPIPVRPGFEGADAKGAWSIKTNIDIFKTYDYNDNYMWTVESSDGDVVIAPGTGNAYTFQLKNTGNISMDYVLTIQNIFDMGEIELPIEVRLKAGDGTYIAGDEENWVYPEDLNKVVETGTLDVNRYATYTLEWQWPFTKEYATSDWHVNDTYAGNAAMHDDLTYTISICTSAQITPGAKPVEEHWPNDIYIPKTGDNTDLMPYIMGLAAATLALCLLVVVRRRKCSDEKGRLQ